MRFSVTPVYQVLELTSSAYRRFHQVDIGPYAMPILDALFRIIESGQTPQLIAANDHLMKCSSPLPLAGTAG